MADWLEDLKEFSPSVVADSCAMWRRSETKRPTPHNIRKLCQEIHHRHRSQRISPPQESQYRPPDHVVRDDWRHRHVREWTRAELETANMEMTDLAHKHGFNSGDDRQDRIDYAKASLRGEVPGYDCVTGREAQWKKSFKVA